MKLNKLDRGRHIQLSAGQEFSLALEANASTGFQWAIVELDETVVRSQSRIAEYKSSDPNGPPGTPGLATFRFTAQDSGNTHLVLAYQREATDEPLETYRLEVTVR